MLITLFVSWSGRYKGFGLAVGTKASKLQTVTLQRVQRVHLSITVPLVASCYVFTQQVLLLIACLLS